MNILHVLDHHWRYNGMVHAAIDLACAQAALGHTVSVCSSNDGSFSSLLKEHGIELVVLPGLSGRFGVLASAAALWNIVGRLKPNVIHAHMTKSALVAYPVSRMRGVALVTCVQNSFSKFAFLMKVGDRVITGCTVVADDMASRGVPPDKLRPVLNGTIGSARQPEPLPGEALAITFQHPAVVTFCGMHWRKGIPDLIAGFQLARRSNPEMNLYIFGEGPNLEEYRLLVDAENTKHVTFCNPVPNAKPYLQAADVFVLASLADPAPLVICEARDAGCAVIATRVDGIPELLEGGEAGILVDAKAPEQIAEKLIYLFSDPGHLQKWRDNSQIGIGKLNVRRVAEESVKVYREVVKSERLGTLPNLTDVSHGGEG